MLNRNSVVLLAMGIFPVCCFSSCTDPEISEKDWLARLEKNIDKAIKILKKCKKSNTVETSANLRAVSEDLRVLQDELQYVNYDVSLKDKRGEYGKKMEKLTKYLDKLQNKLGEDFKYQNKHKAEFASALIEYLTELQMCVQGYADFYAKFNH